MNASATSHEENGVCGSDSDSNPDDSSDYYQPISTADNSGGEEIDDDGGEESSAQDPNSNFHRLPKGWMQNGVSSHDTSDDEDKEKEEEDATESESAIQRAYRDDERRRNAPLSEDNAVRVMEAMRRISFGGASAWADQIAEDQWIDRLRGLRLPSAAAPAGSAPIDH